MEHITKPSITRLARRAGVKSLSGKCYGCINTLIEEQLSSIIETIIVVNSERNNKTIMIEDVYETFYILNKNIAKSLDLNNKSVCTLNKFKDTKSSDK
jgi:histone H3/H4